MKVLILHHHFKTPEKGGALRSYFLAKALVDSGIETVVITTHSHSEYLVSRVDGIEVHYLPIAYSNSFGFYKRIKSFITYILQSVRLGFSLKNIDVCYAMSTPLTIGFVAIALKWTKRIPYIFEVGDLWPDAPIQLGFIKNPILKAALRLTEKFIYRESTSIVALSTTMKELISKRIAGKTVHLIPNMADLDFYHPEPKRSDLIEKFNVQNRFVISYIGSIGFANGLEFVIDCARAIQKAELPVTFLICGEGAVLSYLQETVKKLSIRNLQFIPFKDRNGVKEVMNISDAVLISYRQYEVLETGSPNKYFDGLAAGKLIITNFGGWIKNEIEKEQCGFSIHANRPDELIHALRPYLEEKKKLDAAQAKSRKIAEHYDRTLLSTEFVKIFRQ